MLSPGDTKPGETTSGDADLMFRAIAQIVPNSGVQFIDFVLPRAAIDSVARHFMEQRIVVGDETVKALAPVRPGLGDGHGETSAGRITVSGREAVKSVLDRWLPLPLLRFVSRDGAGRPRFDEGPFNWARLYLSSEGADTGVVRGVVALDTAVSMQSRMDLDAYVAPTLDDVRFGSTFALTDDAEGLAPYLAEDWVQDWLGQAFPARGAESRAPSPAGASLYPVAAYLTLLTLVRRAQALPGLQFVDARTAGLKAVPVDLVLDLGHARSCAMLVENDIASGRPVIADSALLSLRDLSRPTVVHHGTFDSRVTFARPNFGPDALSRRSGRADAFHWPSLVRTGAEAVRLAEATRAEDGATGIGSPRAHLTDLEPRLDDWRFAIEAAPRARRRQMIAGRLLAFAGPSAGLLPAPDGAPRQALPLRPRHALSTLTSFAIAEVLMQAIGAVNAPARLGADRRQSGPRQIRDVIVCVPLTVPVAERELLRERAEAAIDMLWRSLDWDRGDADLVPPRPSVRLGLDETLAAQLVYLYDEIAARFGGDTRAFLDVVGKSRPEFGSPASIRVGALDVGGGHARMTIVTYAPSAHAPIAPVLYGAQRSAIAGEALVDRIIADILQPALVHDLTRHGLAGADGVVAQMRAGAAAGGGHDPASLGRRLDDLCLRPAALALVGAIADLGVASAAGRLDVRLGQLVAARAPLNPHLVTEFAEAVAAAGASTYDLAAVPLSVRLADVATAAEAALAPMVADLSRALVASDCDVVLLTGWPARLGIVSALLLEAMPWRPDRILVLDERDWHGWYPMDARARGAADGKDVGLIGALLALAGGQGLGFGAFADEGFTRGAGGVADTVAPERAAAGARP